MKNIALGISIVLSVIANFSLFNLLLDDDSAGDKMVDKITLENCEQTYDEMSKQWTSTKELLINGLGSEDQTVRFTSACLIGLYRYSEAVHSLSSQIAMEDVNVDRRISKREHPWGRYPAIEALIHIGKPSTPAMLRNLATSKDAHVRGLSARVIYYVEGETAGKKILEDAIEKQAELPKKQRLESSLPLIRGGEYLKPRSR